MPKQLHPADGLAVKLLCIMIPESCLPRVHINVTFAWLEMIMGHESDHSGRDLLQSVDVLQGLQDMQLSGSQDRNALGELRVQHQNLD